MAQKLNYTTITFNQRDAAMLSQRFEKLPSYFKEVPSKKCLWSIDGLVSRSFEYPNEKSNTEIKTLFCNLPVWIKFGFKSVEQSEVPSEKMEKPDNLGEALFGFLSSNVNFSWSEGILNDNNLRWQINPGQQFLVIIYKTTAIRLNLHSLMKYFIISTAYSGHYIIILPLKTPPCCYTGSSTSWQFNNRAIISEICSATCLANSSAVWLRFYDEDSLSNCRDFLMKVLNMNCHEGPIRREKMQPQKELSNLISSDFWSNYAIQMLLALGYRIKSQITQDIVKKISKLSFKSRDKQYSTNECYLKLIAVYYRALRNYFFDINQEFDSIQPMPSSVILNQWEYVPRIYLTPYGVYPLPVKPLKGNRILRERQRFGPGDHFCRVMLRDIDFQMPRDRFIQLKENEQWIKSLFRGLKAITVGNREFYFLLCSSSQLRDRSFWFHAPYENRGAEYIRQWMGDVSHEKSVGTRIARMALTLTGTTPTITLLSHQIERIEDKRDAKGRIFTDGIGKISEMALRKALEKFNPKLIENEYMPCVIQVRLNGIKGVLALAPDLADRGTLIQYRGSQHKFSTNHNVLEIIKHASSNTGSLNRQVITLLENMGIPQHTFLKLQNKVRMRICESLLDSESAQRTLEQHVRNYAWGRMHKAGIGLANEPFARGLLSLLALKELRLMKEKSQVPMPLSDARMLMGIVDETNSLRYGQVFIKLRDLDGKSQVIANRKVLVTKNPAHFPGDVRLLNAVDCRALHHLSECIVFPAEGERPHPNEISGGDLDGDEYWVYWDKDFVNGATKQYDPAIFDSVPKKKHSGEITMEVIANFLYEFMSFDTLRLLSNDHVLSCALYDPNHDISLDLAKAISQAVDSAKTGVYPEVNIKLDKNEFPDFMENKDKKSLQPNSSIGKMYRQIKEVCKLYPIWEEQIEEQSDLVDPNLLIEGYERFVSVAEEDYQYYSARINNMLFIYNLQTEYELVTGCHLCPEEESKNSYSVETALMELQELREEMQDRFGENSLNEDNKLRKASAWYYIAYKRGVILSFGWIMDRLMSEIIGQKSILHGEYETWEYIGQAMCKNGKIIMEIEQAGFFHNLNGEQFKNCSGVQRLGGQLLTIIEQFNECPTRQPFADAYLLFLHKVALGLV